ncbi:MAG: Stk1 family PASTA domain-containing Ser/Thr kinase [Clostridia bacterium]|nr:Stk1 family PASTA domain-containing Ser/Thr kinase [Clostridia bacterium]
MNLIGKNLGNRYEILKEIGAGGMAYVYLAQCKLLNRKVAVKVLRPELAQDKEFLRRFEVEAQAAACLNHPNIVGVYDVGQDYIDEYSINYIVMEYVEGITLKEYIDKQKVLSWREALNYAIQICEGLRHAHKNGVVHRDIKPHNIIITKDGKLKVTDFGIACAVTKNTVTITKSAIGSVHYFSPEQSRGGITDAKSDLYSLGIVLYEMLTGKLPFDGDSHVSIAIKHIQERPVSPKNINVSIPLAVENIVLNAIQKRPEDRYPSAEEMLVDLHSAEASPDVIISNSHSSDDFGKTMKFKDTDEVIKKVLEMEKEVTDQPKVKDTDNSDKKTVIFAIIVSLCLILIFGIGIASYLGGFSGGSKEEKVPDVVGEVYEDIKKEYEKAKINIVMIQEVDSAKYDQGVIVSQDPQPGTVKKTPFDVSVTVSKGSKKSRIVNYERQEYSSVEFELNNLGFVVTKSEEHSSTIPKDTVIRTEPKAGDTIETGSEIIVYVSIGPELGMIPMPDLVNLSYAQAKIVIENNNLRIGKTSREPSSKPNGTVIRQSIPVNEEVEEFTVVDLVLSSGGSNVNGKNYTVSVPSNKDNTKIVVVQNGSVIHNQVHNRNEGSFNITLSGNGTVKIEIYYDDVLSKQETIQL